MKATFFKQSLIVTMLMTLIIACSKNANNPMPEQQADTKETLLSRQLTNKDITDFLDSYYGTYTFGDTEEAYEDNNTYEVTEVFASSTLPIGYVVSEKLTEDFLYFAHFDRDNDEIEAFNVKLNEYTSLNDLGEDDNGNKITEIDVLEYVKNFDNTQGRRFWGWTCGVQQLIGIGENQQCYRHCCYHIIWFRNQCGNEPCDDLPGSNPVIIN